MSEGAFLLTPARLGLHNDPCQRTNSSPALKCGRGFEHVILTRSAAFSAFGCPLVVVVACRGNRMGAAGPSPWRREDRSRNGAESETRLTKDSPGPLRAIEPRI